MLVGHDDVGEGGISLGLVGNSTSGGSGRRVEERDWLAVLHLPSFELCYWILMGLVN